MRALAALLVAGCSGGAPIARADFAAAFAEAACSAQARCAPMAACLAAQCRAQAVVAPAADFDPAAARACVDAVANAPCAPGGPYAVDETVCLRVVSLPPGLPAGAACNIHQQQCGPGLICSDGGVCLAPAGAGAACQFDADCVAGFVCVEGRCASLRRAGAGCSVDESCAPGLYCAGGACAARKGAGSACGVDDIDAALRDAECAAGLFCIGAGLTLDGVALPGRCGPASLEGGRCSAALPGMQIQITGCGDGLACRAGACAPDCH